ncbi:hypothetical protein LCGC14_0204960 [marine sediment metagenome]|uniref:Uncharacterized protein n=1 Tax=marine sediment metagenome TaxID=412755 RepID=A0A0F9XKY8_9ZZZZ
MGTLTRFDQVSCLVVWRVLLFHKVLGIHASWANMVSVPILLNQKHFDWTLPRPK